MKFSRLIAYCFFFFGLVGLFASVLAPPAQAQAQSTGGSCGGEGRSFLGIPSWDRGLDPCEDIEIEDFFKDDPLTNQLTILINNFVAIATHVAAMVAVGFIIYGGFCFVLSTGNAEKATAARKTIINAAIGALIVIMAQVATEIIYKSLTG